MLDIDERNRLDGRLGGLARCICDGHRRGNAIVMVAAILVLLVIIATAYVSRTQAGRATAQAVQRTHDRDALSQQIAESIASEIALSLFTFPPPAGSGVPVDSNQLLLDPSAVDGFEQRFALDTVHPYHFAPFETRPFTNWPDATTNPVLNTNLPSGPGNPTGGGGSDYLLSEWNPVGNPGSGDARWLADSEPQRVWRDYDGDGDYEQTISHWRKMTNLSRANNGWRVVRSIADVLGDDPSIFPSGLVTNLLLPIEQWLATPPNYAGNQALVAAGHDNARDRGIPGGSNVFYDQWLNWMGDPFNGFDLQLEIWSAALAGLQDPSVPLSPPGNLYRLSDLDGDGVKYNLGEYPETEFELGSIRNVISQRLADTDGDGFTDAYWHLPPFQGRDGTRTVVAVRIVDNSALLNVNAATRFVKNDLLNPSLDPQATRGHTPADLALLGQNFDDATSDTRIAWNTGFYDSPANESGSVIDGPFDGGPTWQAWDYFPSRWTRHPDETGLLSLNPTALQRLDWWRHGTRRQPLTNDAVAEPDYFGFNAFYSPFDLADELELRMFHGQNSEWAYTQYEWSVQATGAGDNERFLRADYGDAETSERRGQLSNRMLVKDNRRKLTTYSGARNETMPPWLWFEQGPLLSIENIPVWLPGPVRRDMARSQAGGGSALPVYNNFLAQSRVKQDLRRSYRSDEFRPAGHLSFRERLPVIVMDALLEGDQSYLGDVPGDATLEEVRRLAAAFSANIAEYRDFDTDRIFEEPPTGFGPSVPAAAPLVTPVVENFVDPHAFTLAPAKGEDDESVASKQVGYLGMEAQPFILEVFICHLHGSEPLPDVGLPGLGPRDICGFPGNFVDDSHEQRTIVAVQLVNPYEFPIELSQYKIRVFDREFDCATIPITDQGRYLEPATEEAPRATTFILIPDDFDSLAGPGYGGTDFRDRWLDYLDLLPEDQPAGSYVYQLRTDPSDNAAALPNDWASDRNHYDTFAQPDDYPLVELVRKDFIDGSPFDVVIDRVRGTAQGGGSNPSTFIDTIRRMTPPPAAGPVTPVVGGRSIKPGVRLGEYEFLTQWVSVRRMWGNDFIDPGSPGDPSNPGAMQPYERNPRFVFADHVVTSQRFLTAAQKPTIDLPRIDQYLSLSVHFDYFDCIAPPPGSGSVQELIADNPLIVDNGSGAFVGYIGTPYRDVTSRDPDENGTFDPWARGLWFDEQVDRGVGNPVFRHKPTFFSNQFYNFDEVSDLAMYRQGGDLFEQLYTDQNWGIPFKCVPGDERATGILSDTEYPLQMLQKDADYEQIGELMNVWLYGHEVQYATTPFVISGVTFNDVSGYVETVRTFSEHMSDETIPGVGTGPRINRLRPHPESGDEFPAGVIGRADPFDLTDPLHAVPAMPAGLRALDLFVLDDGGVSPGDVDGDGVFDGLVDVAASRFDLANGYSGRATPGLININTAPVEVLRTLPHWYKMVHSGPFFRYDPDSTPGPSPARVVQTSDPRDDRPWTRTAIADAVIQWRERHRQIDADMASQALLGRPFGPDYSGGRREQFTSAIGDDVRLTGIDGRRGFSSPAEILLLEQPGAANAAEPDEGHSESIFHYTNETLYPRSWSVSYAAPAPTRNVSGAFIVDDFLGFLDAPASLSIDVNNPPYVNHAFDEVPSFPADARLGMQLEDAVAGDAEEMSLLYAGASNLTTVRSDTFTVYFKVRTFKQDPVTGRWDATNRENIVDDARYVMLVDRSNVNTPSDKPRIVYLQRVVE